VSDTKGPNSYELSVLANRLAEAGADGFDSDEDLTAWQSALDGYIEVATDKFAACSAVIRRANHDAEFLRSEAARFANAAAKLDAVAARVTERTLMLLQAHEAATGQSKVTFDGTAWVKIARRHSTRCEVTCDGADLPFRFQAMKITPDKKAITAALEAGEMVDGCSMVPYVSESVSFSK